MNKYKLTKETKTLKLGRKLFRIEYLKDIGIIKKGDEGGWLEYEDNLSQDGTSLVLDNAMVYEDARVSHNAVVSENAKVFGGALIMSDAKVYGNATIFGKGVMVGNAELFGNAIIFGATYLYNHSKIGGDVEIPRGILKVYPNSAIPKGFEIFDEEMSNKEFWKQQKQEGQ